MPIPQPKDMWLFFYVQKSSTLEKTKFSFCMNREKASAFILYENLSHDKDHFGSQNKSQTCTSLAV